MRRGLFAQVLASAMRVELALDRQRRNPGDQDHREIDRELGD
jgi:hypothetical protein